MASAPTFAEEVPCDELADGGLAVGGLAPRRTGIREGALTFFGETVFEGVLSRIWRKPSATT